MDRRVGPLAVVGSVLVVRAPVLAVGLILSWLLMRRRRSIRADRVDADDAIDEEVLFVHALLIGISGGLGLLSALALARDQLRTSLRSIVDDVLDAAQADGLSPVLLASSGPLGGLFRQLGASHLSGAPLVLALSAHAHELHERERAAQLERVRQLPIRMVVPLTLLMLPGFLLVAIGPTVVGSFSRLMAPFGN